LIELKIKMGNCSSGSKEDQIDSKQQVLNTLDIANIKHSWTFVVKSGLKENGVNMMIRYYNNNNNNNNNDNKIIINTILIIF
jgi:hypothetical protein